MAEKKLNLSEHVEALFEGVEDVKAEQKEKMETVLEAAVSAILAEEREVIQEQIETKATELVEAKANELEEVVGKYLDYAVGEWKTENKIALETGMKVELAESFLSGFMNVLSEHNVSIPEGQEDIVAAHESKIAELEEKLNESASQVIELTSTVRENEKASIVSQVSEGLTDTQTEKLNKLVEGFEFTSAEVYADKVKTVRESYFSGGAKEENETPKQLKEEIDTSDPNAIRLAAIRSPYQYP